MRLWTGEGSADEAEEFGLAALPLLEETGDHIGLAYIWLSLAYGAYNYRARGEQIVQAVEQARRYEALAGLPHQRSESVYAMGLLYGPRPVGEVLERLEELAPSVRIDLWRAIALAMSDRIDEARALAHAAEEHARELGETAHADIAEIESLAGDHDAAAERLRLWCEWRVEHNIVAEIAAEEALRGRELSLAGRFEEAEQCAKKARDLGLEAPYAQAFWRQAAALAGSHRGDHAEAERLAREALVHANVTDSPALQADAYCDLAEVLEAAGRRDEAIAAWQEALDRYERKGIVPLARRVSERLAALQTA
jgi:tetratricopeptide (TPR) repeat protein